MQFSHESGYKSFIMFSKNRDDTWFMILHPEQN